MTFVNPFKNICILYHISYHIISVCIYDALKHHYELFFLFQRGKAQSRIIRDRILKDCNLTGSFSPFLPICDLLGKTRNSGLVAI